MNGYISINIDGKTIGLKFAYPAITMFAEAMQKSGQFYYTMGDQATMTIEGIAKFIECGYRNNCMIKEVEPELKYEDFYNWCELAVTDKGKMEQVAKVLECYAGTVYAKKIQEEAEKITEDQKKNSSGMTLQESSNTNAVTEPVS